MSYSSTFMWLGGRQSNVFYLSIADCEDLSCIVLFCIEPHWTHLNHFNIMIMIMQMDDGELEWVGWVWIHPSTLCTLLSPSITILLLSLESATKSTADTLAFKRESSNINYINCINLRQTITLDFWIILFRIASSNIILFLVSRITDPL